MSLSVTLAAFKVGKWWYKVRPIKTFNTMRSARKALKESNVFKGKLTYISIAAVAAPILARILGIDLPPETIVLWFQAGASIVGVYGRWRANR